MAKPISKRSIARQVGSKGNPFARGLTAAVSSGGEVGGGSRGDGDGELRRVLRPHRPRPGVAALPRPVVEEAPQRLLSGGGGVLAGGGRRLVEAQVGPEREVVPPPELRVLKLLGLRVAVAAREGRRRRVVSVGVPVVGRRRRRRVEAGVEVELERGPGGGLVRGGASGGGAVMGLLLVVAEAGRGVGRAGRRDGERGRAVAGGGGGGGGGCHRFHRLS